MTLHPPRAALDQIHITEDDIGDGEDEGDGKVYLEMMWMYCRCQWTHPEHYETPMAPCRSAYMYSTGLPLFCCSSLKTAVNHVKVFCDNIYDMN